MSKHWRLEDDEFLIAYYDIMGDFIGEHDLGRKKGAATRRVAHLKKTGAWDALADLLKERNRSNMRHLRAELAYAKAIGWQVEETGVSDEEAECPADIYDGGFPWRRDPWGEDAEAKADAEREMHAEMVAALREARLQIEYLHEKFQATGTGETTLHKIKSALAAAGAAA
jgi:hypothetical protein